jgi:ferredoxin
MTPKENIIKAYRKIIYLHFPPEASTQPVVCNLAKQFDLTFNILKANILPRREGAMIIELSGSEEMCRKGFEYLQEHGVKVVPVAQRTSRDEESCIHCGVCTALCPTNALALNLKTRLIEFDREKCTGCGMCTRVCPVKAMHVELEQGL